MGPAEAGLYGRHGNGNRSNECSSHFLWEGTLNAKLLQNGREFGLGHDYDRVLLNAVQQCVGHTGAVIERFLGVPQVPGAAPDSPSPASDGVTRST